MKTRIIEIDPSAANPHQVAELAAVLLADGVIAYPTETFYGLGAAGLSAPAVARIYKLKRREEGKALSLIVSDLGMVLELAESPSPAFQALAQEFWPGPLTLVVKAAPTLPQFLTGPGGTVAVRIPPVTWIRDLVEEISQPLTATSANISGHGEISDPAEVAAVFDGRVELIVDGGLTPGGAASTIVDVTGSPARILREGVIPAAKIREFVNIQD